MCLRTFSDLDGHPCGKGDVIEAPMIVEGRIVQMPNRRG
jgi:hypothetical protein